MGHDHNPYFKASVNVNSYTYASTSMFKTSKDAQNDVVVIALSQLLLPKGSRSVFMVELESILA